MAGIDVIVKKYAQSILLPGFVMAFVLYKSRSQLLTMYKVTYAWMLNRIGVSYNKKMGKRKQKLFAQMHDAAAELAPAGLRILEIGAGSGTNFKFYPEGSRITCVDPNPYFEGYLMKHVSQFPHVVLDRFVISGAEDMSTVPTGSIDAAVCTLVLCTVQDVSKVLNEVRRVLKEGGKFYYLEHVAAPNGTWTCKIQEWLNPIWKIVGDNCHLTRKTGQLVEMTGFSAVENEYFIAKLRFPLINYHLAGIATK